MRVELQDAVAPVHYAISEGITGGTFTISVYDFTGTLLGTTPALAFNASTTTMQTAIRAIHPDVNLTTVTGSAISTGYTITLANASPYR